MSPPLRTNFSIHVIWNQQTDEHINTASGTLTAVGKRSKRGTSTPALSEPPPPPKSYDSQALVTFIRFTKKPPGTASVGAWSSAHLARTLTTCPSRRATADTHRALVQVSNILSSLQVGVLGRYLFVEVPDGRPVHLPPRAGRPHGEPLHELAAGTALQQRAHLVVVRQERAQRAQEALVPQKHGRHLALGPGGCNRERRSDG
jgi:hypothetical protein